MVVFGYIVSSFRVSTSQISATVPLWQALSNESPTYQLELWLFADMEFVG